MEDKERKEIIVDGRNITDMEWAELQKYVVEMTEELIMERGERTRIRKECDVMRTSWENSEFDMQESKATLIKKFVEAETLWDKYKVPYAEKEQEITYQKFITNYDIQFLGKENKKRIEQVNKKWDEKVLPKLMDKKSQKAQRFDQKRKEMSKEFNEVQDEYVKILTEMVTVLDDKIYDWTLNTIFRLMQKNTYDDFQVRLKQTNFCEQKNLLIHHLNNNYKFHFENTRNFVRERVEGDTKQILSLNEELAKQQKEYEYTKREIELYKRDIKYKEEEFENAKHVLEINEGRLASYKDNVNKANRCCKRIKFFEKEIKCLKQRKFELENEMSKRREEKKAYMDVMESVKSDSLLLQAKFFGNDFMNKLKERREELLKFDRLLASYEKEVPDKVRLARVTYAKEKTVLEALPSLIAKEIKGHNEFIEATMVRLKDIGLSTVPTFVRINHPHFPTSEGPAFLNL